METSRMLEKNASRKELIHEKNKTMTVLNNLRDS